MSALLMAVAFAVVALLAYLGRYSGRIRAEASRAIGATASSVSARVAELTHWEPWNPWLALAPTGKGVSEVHGDRLRWDAEPVGRGEVRALRRGGSLEQELRLFLPMACRGRSVWRFEVTPGGTHVTWRFEGRVAFTLRALAPTVQGALALDMRWGLDRLAGLLEPGPSAYELGRAEVVQHEGSQAIGHLGHARLEDLPQSTTTGIAELRGQLGRDGHDATGVAVALFLRTHLKRRAADHWLGIEQAAGSPVNGGMSLRQLPPQCCLVMAALVRPEDLELAWYVAMQQLRVGGHHPDPQRPPFARYLDDPVLGRLGRVQLHLPLR